MAPYLQENTQTPQNSCKTPYNLVLICFSNPLLYISIHMNIYIYIFDIYVYLTFHIYTTQGLHLELLHQLLFVMVFQDRVL
jgi:hypothetical protein